MTQISAPQPDDGPAFPCTICRYGDEFAHEGMSLRDYFAAKAMAAILAQPDNWADVPPKLISESAYRQADEMLKARQA